MYFPLTEVYIYDQAAIATIAMLVYFINFLLTVRLFFLDRRNPQRVCAWVLVLFFIPFVGFILYMLFRRTIYRQQIFKLDEEDKVGLEHLVSEQLEEIKKGRLTLSSPVAEKHKKLVHMLLYNNQSFVTSNNSVETYTNMNDK